MNKTRINPIKQIITTFAILFIFSPISAQNHFSLNGGMGISKMKFGTGRGIIKINGFAAEIGVMYNIKKFGLGLNVPIYNYSKFENPGNLQLTYSPDITSVVRYGNPFFQQNTNLTYFFPTLFVKYDITFFKRLKLRVASGISRVEGTSHQVTLSAPGDFEPTTVSYSTSSESQWSWHNHYALLFNINSSNSIGLKANYENKLKYWGFLLYFETSLRKR